MLGLLAYGLYKQEKIEFIERYKAEHDGVGPTDDDLAPFHDISSSSTRIKNYKQIAETTLNRVMDQLMENNIEAFREASAEGQRKAIAELKPTIKTYVLGGIVGNISFILATGIIFYIVYCVRNDFPGQVMGWIKKFFDFAS